MFRTHWWTRPQWEGVPARIAWYIEPGPAMIDAVASIQRELAAPHLEPVPLRWLHATLETLGPVHRVDVDALTARARTALRGLVPFEVRGMRLEVWEEGVVWLLEPVERLAELRAACAVAAGADLGRWFVPHMSISYANGDAEDAPARAVVAAHAYERPAFDLSEVMLVALRIERRVYLWDELARVRLGG